MVVSEQSFIYHPQIQLPNTVVYVTTVYTLTQIYPFNEAITQEKPDGNCTDMGCLNLLVQPIS